jgi:hypothetical protein
MRSKDALSLRLRLKSGYTLRFDAFTCCGDDAHLQKGLEFCELQLLLFGAPFSALTKMSSVPVLRADAATESYTSPPA